MGWLLPPLPPTFEAALRDVRARSIEARSAAAERLAEPEPAETQKALEGLIALASDSHANVRAAALRGLKQLGHEDALDCLLERLDDSDALVRELAVVAIGTLGGARAEPVLLRALRSPHPEVRFQAIASYVEACEPDNPGAVVTLLRDPDPKVRGNAARNLSRFGEAAYDDLRHALADEDTQVRSEAALALARSGDPCGAAALRTALGDPELVVETLDVIGALGLRELSDEAAAIAQAVLKPLGLKVAAARALLRLGDARGTPALREVLRAFRSDGRSYAVQVVGELRIGELAGELARLATRLRGVDPDTLVDALVALLPDSEQARSALRTLARRSDHAGEIARLALSG